MYDVAGRSRAHQQAGRETANDARRPTGPAPGPAALYQLGDAINAGPHVIALKRLSGGLSVPIQRVRLRPDGGGGYNKVVTHRSAPGDVDTNRLSAQERAQLLERLRPDQRALHDEIVGEAAVRDQEPWVFVVGRNAFAWGGDPSVPPADRRPLPPAFWQGLEELPEVPAGAPVLTVQEYRVMMRGSGPRAPSDHYNPYGRFATAEHSSFVPSGLDAQGEEMLFRHLEQKDASFIRPNALNMSHAPDGSHVLTDDTGEIVLYPHPHQVGFGTHYSSVRPPTGPARAGPAPARDEHTDVRVHAPFEITKPTIDAWSGQERSVQQAQVMGARSAAMVAEEAGFDPEIGWEWLHLVAHSMGGLPGVGPQLAENLVAGTSAANSAMIIAEEFLKDMVRRTGATLTLSVQTAMLDRYIADTIVYDALLDMGDGRRSVYHWDFDCLSTVHPQASWNRQVRAHGRASLGLLGDEDSSGFGIPHVQQSIFRYAGPDRLAVRMDDEITRNEEEKAQSKNRAFQSEDEVAQGEDAMVEADGPDERLTTEEIAASYGHHSGWDIGQIIEAYAALPAVRIPFITTLIHFHPNAEFLGQLREALLALGGKLPGEIEHAFDEPGPYLIVPSSDDEMEAGEADEDDGARAETSKRGNCLFEAVNIVLGNGRGMDRALRQLCTQYFVNHPGLAAAAGVNAYDVITTLATPGRWAGDAGDLSPAVLASAIGRNIVIVTDYGRIVAQAAQPTQGEIQIYLSGGHYTVEPTTAAQLHASVISVISINDKLPQAAENTDMTM